MLCSLRVHHLESKQKPPSKMLSSTVGIFITGLLLDFSYAFRRSPKNCEMEAFTVPRAIAVLALRSNTNLETSICMKKVSYEHAQLIYDRDQ